MKRLLGLSLVAALTLAEANENVSPPGSNGWHFEETRRFAAPEARQGVAADRDFLYVISNHDLGKYNKTGGVRVAAWSCSKGDPLTHVNAGIIYKGRLYGAHSNYPGVPHLSSVEIWETESLQHVGSVSFGRTDGSLTWIDRREGRWLACFAHYVGKGGEPGRGQEWTRLVEYDDDWRPTGRGWAFPPEVFAYLGARGFSLSGGGIGPGGYLFVTGHDAKAFCVLAFPEAGSVLHWEATVPMSAEGQAFAWDPVEAGVVHLVLKGERKVITGRIKRVDVKAN